MELLQDIKLDEKGTIKKNKKIAKNATSTNVCSPVSRNLLLTKTDIQRTDSKRRGINKNNSFAIRGSKNILNEKKIKQYEEIKA